MPLNFYSETDKQMTDIQQTDKTYNLKTFPHDVEQDGDTSLMIININTATGAKYLGGQSYYLIDGPEGRATYQRGGGATGARLRGGTRRISDAIVLYMPNEITTSYTSNYDAVNLGSAGRIGDIAQNVASGELPNWDAVKNATKSGTVNLAASTADTIFGTSFKDMKKAMTMTMVNPFTEVIFNGVENRTFSFSFRFMPRNASEQRTVEEIVDMLKYHRAPEYQFASEQQYSYWAFPSEFDIQFYHKGKVNDHIFKISTCVMTNLTVDHSGENHYAVHADGAPVTTDLKLEFMEVEVLTKERIDKMGF